MFEIRKFWKMVIASLVTLTLINSVACLASGMPWVEGEALALAFGVAAGGSAWTIFWAMDEFDGD